MSQRKFAAFDIDGTLVRWQFYHAIVHELGRAQLMDPKLHAKIRDARMRWKKREHSESFRNYESTLVRIYLDALEHINERDHDRIIAAVFDEYKDQFFTYSRDLLKQLKADDYLIFAISGSHEAILEKLAAHIGIDDFIGARFDFIDGKYIGTGSTPIKDKAASVWELVKRHDATFAGSVAIGDSESDIAMLQLVEQPIAFNPTHGLFEHAKQQGWKIVVERKNVVYELENRDGPYLLA